MCPPGVDQTTRSRQQWHILAPLAKERYNVTDDCASRRSYSTSLSAFLNGDFTWDAFEKLACRTALDVCGVESILAKLPYSTHTGNLSSIEALPDELLAMIFSDNALNASDVIAFGLCSRMLWQHCLGHIRTSLSKGPWANTPLVCTGTYLADLPDTLHRLVPSLKQQEEDWQNRQPQQGHGMRGGPRMCPVRRWNWNAVSTYSDTSTTNMDEWLGALDSLPFSKESAGVPAEDKKILRQSLERILATSKPKPGSQWFLRNLNTQQYVQLRCAFNGAMEPQLHVKGLPWLTLDKALVMRFAWTSLDMYHEYTPMLERILRGEWAGHRFDVVTAAEDMRPGMEEWVDITAEILEAGRGWKPQSAALR